MIIIKGGGVHGYLGNVNVGAVSFNGTGMNRDNISPPTTYYTLFNVPGPVGQVKWKTEGNGAFKPLDVEITRGFPVITTGSDVPQTYSICANCDFSLSIPGFISNYDSLFVAVGDNMEVAKILPAGSTAIYFTNAEISRLSIDSAIGVVFSAFNYSNKIAEDKMYLFELSTKAGAYLLKM